MRRAIWILGIVAGLAFLAVFGLAVVLPRLDLAAFAAARAQAAFGREVGIESLRVSPGFMLTVELRGARLANIEGGSEPDMVRLGSATAELEWLPLLRGQVVARRLAVDGLHVLLERAPERRANWRFVDRPRPPPATAPVTEPQPPPDRSGFPILLDARITGSEIVFRTTGGSRLVTRLDDVGMTAPDARQPIALRGQGGYHGVPVALDATLGSFAALHATETPFPMRFRADSGDVWLRFDGTATDPLNFDGLDGRVEMEAPTLKPVLGMAGVGEEDVPDAALSLAARFRRHTDLWRMAELQGRFQGATLTADLVQLIEGVVGQSNQVALDMALAALDLNRLLGRPGSQAQGAAEPDLPLVVPTMPDPLLQARLEIGELAYGDIRAGQLKLRAVVAPARIAIEEASGRAFGSGLSGSAEVVPGGQGARITGDVALVDGNLDTLRRAFGLTALPASGQVEARVALAMQGRMLNEATRRARISAVVSMRHGRVAREVIEMASTDVRALFRTARGTTAVSCLLAVVDIRDSRGEAAPFRIRSAEGTIGGIARFDLSRETLDLVIGSERATTGFLALDIPVRVSGSFSDPSIAPASWSRQGREQLAQADSRIAPLPPALRQFAQSNPCIRRTTQR